MSSRVALSIALGVVGALALVGVYLGIVAWAQGPDHALELIWDDRVFVGLISSGFGTQIGLFTYVRLMQRALARESIALTGAGTATSSISMVACCAHHLAEVLPIVGLSGLAVFLVDFRTPLMLVGLATNALGIAVMLRELRRIGGGYRLVVRHVEGDRRAVSWSSHRRPGVP
ncbi:MAG TPA: hypothetical protein VI056_12745 [Candidatus Limnocylindria bacterium]